MGQSRPTAQAIKDAIVYSEISLGAQISAETGIQRRIPVLGQDTLESYTFTQFGLPAPTSVVVGAGKARFGRFVDSDRGGLGSPTAEDTEVGPAAGGISRPQCCNHQKPEELSAELVKIAKARQVDIVRWNHGRGWRKAVCNVLVYWQRRSDRYIQANTRSRPE